MSRAYQTYGEVLVKVKGGQQLQNFGMSGSTSVVLGVGVDPFYWGPGLNHTDVNTDKTSIQVPADVMWMGADCQIKGRLVHYDRDILDVCLNQAMAGYNVNDPTESLPGQTLGHNLALYASGNYYMSLNLVSSVSSGVRFRATYLTSINFPYTSDRSIVDVTFRSIRYTRMNLDGSIATPSLLFDYGVD